MHYALISGINDQPLTETITMTTIRSWADLAKGGRFESYEFDPGPLGTDEIEIAVKHYGICPSDLSILENDWGIST